MTHYHFGQERISAIDPRGALQRQRSYPLGYKNFDPNKVDYANDFHEAWVEHREGIELSLTDAFKAMEKGTNLKYACAQVWVRNIETGRLFVPFLYHQPRMDYYPLVRLHAKQCKVNQEMLNEWAELLPEGIEGKKVTPVDIHNVF